MSHAALYSLICALVIQTIIAYQIFCTSSKGDDYFRYYVLQKVCKVSVCIMSNNNNNL